MAGIRRQDSFDFPQFFDQVRIISLRHRADRRALARHEMGRQGIVIGEGNVQFLDAFRPDDRGAFPSIGARGCFLSHLAVLRSAANERVDSVLILEDDVAFAPRLSSRFHEIGRALEETEWSIFHGGCGDVAGHAEQPSTGPVALVDPGRALTLAHCIAFRGEAIAECAEYLSSILERPAGSEDGGPMHVDGAYSWYRRSYPDRQTWMATPGIAYQQSSRSDISTDLKWFDRSAFLAPALTKIRMLKSRLRGRNRD